MFAPDPHRAAVAARRERERGARRQAILDAARAAVSEGGLKALSIRSIGRKAGVSIGGVYVYFRSIDELQAGLVADGHRSALAVIRRREKLSLEPAARLRANARIYVEVILDRFHLFEQTARLKFALDEELISPEAAEELRASVREAISPFEEPIAEGQRLGLFRTDRPARRVAAQLWGSLNGILLVFRRDARRTPQEGRRFVLEYAADVTDIFLDALTAPPERGSLVSRRSHRKRAKP